MIILNVTIGEGVVIIVRCRVRILAFIANVHDLFCKDSIESGPEWQLGPTGMSFRLWVSKDIELIEMLIVSRKWQRMVQWWKKRPPLWLAIHIDHMRNFVIIPKWTDTFPSQALSRRCVIVRYDLNKARRWWGYLATSCAWASDSLKCLWWHPLTGQTRSLIYGWLNDLIQDRPGPVIWHGTGENIKSIRMIIVSDIAMNQKRRSGRASFISP